MDIRSFFGGKPKQDSEKIVTKPIPTPNKSKGPTPEKHDKKKRVPSGKAKTNKKSSALEISTNKKLETTPKNKNVKSDPTPEKPKVLEKRKPSKENNDARPLGKAQQEKNGVKKEISTKKTDKSKEISAKLPNKKSVIDSDDDVEITCVESDDSIFDDQQKVKKVPENKKSAKDKNGNIASRGSLSSLEPVRSSKKSKKPIILESSEDEEIIQSKNKGKKKSKQSKKGGVIFDSEEDEDPLPKSPKKRKPRKKKDLYISDSDDECRQTRIEEVFQKSAKKPAPKPKTPESSKQHTPKKQISVADFFGTSSVHRTERQTPATKRKAETSPILKADPDLEIHDDDDFEETLRLLDEDDGHRNKKQKVQEEPKSLASKLSDKVKAGFCIQETPERPSAPKKSSPGKATPGKAMPKNSPEKVSPKPKTPGKASVKNSPEKVSPKPKTPAKASVKTSPDVKTPLEKKPTGYKTYLTREGPRALGSKEIPQGADNCMEGLTFVITGVLESMERDEAKSLVERYGGRVTGSLSKKTNYIVLGRDPGESKLSKANQFGTKQIDEDELLNLVRTLPGKKSKYEAAAEKEAAKMTPGKRKVSPTKADGPPEKKAAPGPAMTPKTKSFYGSQPSTPKTISAPSTPKLSTSSRASPSTPAQGVAGSGETLLWVDKYKPTSLKQVIGQNGDKSNAKKLLHWLKMWHKNIAAGKKPAFNRFNDDGSGCRAALLSGPPGVGKTTTAHLVCKESGFTFVELNASDTRSKKSLKQDVAESLNNQSLAGYFNASNTGESSIDSHNHCLVMDEVDGMAGNEDRGGMQELIALIKNTKIPVICMCNDRNHQKIRSLANHCFDLRFQRPRLEQIKAAMMTMAFKEGVRIPPPALNEIIMASNQDVRQVIHNLSMWSADEKNLSYDQVKKDASKAKKDMKLGPFDVVRKVFTGGEETAGMTINDKSDLFFHDYSFGPLFVQENYISVNPFSARGDVKKHLQLLSRTADSIALGDTVDRLVRSQQKWNLLPLQAIFASVIPGETLRGNLGGQIQFPQWLGKNSTRSKNDRILQELKSHMKLQISCDKKGLNMDYLPHFRHSLTLPLIRDGVEGVASTIQQLDDYDLLKEDFDSILEVSQWPNSKDVMGCVETKVKSALTRTYNKESHLTPYATGNVAKKGRKRGGDDLDDLDGEGAGQAAESEEEGEDVTLDSMIKAKKAKPTKATASKAKATDKSKTTGGKAGRGRGKGRGK